MMRQLDLFGMPEESASSKEEQPESGIVVQMPSEKKDESPVEFIRRVPQEKPEIKVEEKQAPYRLQKPTVVFEDEKIGVKIKALPEQKEEKLDPEPEKTGASKRGRKSFREMDAESDLTEVPDDEALFSKQYYSISQVASWFKVNNSLIRYWENEFDVLKPRKNRKGDRLFRPEDVKNLQLIYHLLRQRKFTIEGAKEYIKAHKTKADTNMQLVQSLTKFKTFLLELRANLGE